MAIDVQKSIQRALDVKRFLPSPRDILQPLPKPQQGELVMQGITADVLSYALGLIPYVGGALGNAVSDNIMADVRERLTSTERDEFAEQNRFYPSGIALLRTFQRTRVAPGGSS